MLSGPGLEESFRAFKEQRTDHSSITGIEKSKLCNEYGYFSNSLKMYVEYVVLKNIANKLDISLSSLDAVPI